MAKLLKLVVMRGLLSGGPTAYLRKRKSRGGRLATEGGQKSSDVGGREGDVKLGPSVLSNFV